MPSHWTALNLASWLWYFQYIQSLLPSILPSVHQYIPQPPLITEPDMQLWLKVEGSDTGSCWRVTRQRRQGHQDHSISRGDKRPSRIHPSIPPTLTQHQPPQAGARLLPPTCVCVLLVITHVTNPSAFMNVTEHSCFLWQYLNTFIKSKKKLVLSTS